MFSKLFQFAFFYLLFLYFFSLFFYFDPEFFLSFSAFIIFFFVFAIINSYSTSLINDKFNNYKSNLSTLSMLLTSLDDYTTQLTIYIEDITETLFYFSMYEETLDSEYETIFDDKMFQNSLNVFFSHSLFHLFQLEYEEKTAVQTTLLNTCAFSFINEFDFDNFKYPKHLGPEIHIWFYEPRSLKQLYVARAIKPSDYIMPESAYIDLLVFKKTIC